MDRQTRSGMKRSTSATKSGGSPRVKKSKLVRSKIPKIAKGMQAKLSRSPKINKTISGKTKPVNVRNVLVKGSELPTGNNNNAQIANDAHEAHSSTGPAKQVSTVTHSKFKGCENSSHDDADHVNVNVRDSENEFHDDGSSDEDNVRDVPYSQESESEAESEIENNDSDSTGSEVVIRRPTAKEIKAQELEELKVLAENPHFQTLVEGMVNTKVQDVLKSMNQPQGTPAKNNAKFIKKVVS